MGKTMKEGENILRQQEDIETTTITSKDLETKIYRMSGENMLKIDEKDSIVELLPQVMLAINRKANSLEKYIDSINNEGTKAMVIDIVGKAKLL